MKNIISFLLVCSFLCLVFNAVFAQGGDSYSVVWTTEPGDTDFGFSMATTNRVINNKLGLKAGFDFDGDGNLEFLTSLQSSNEEPGRDNNLYLFEADGDNNYALRWSYKVAEVPHQRNGMAVGDLDEDGNSEIIWIVDQLEAETEDNVLIFEYDPASQNFPSAPTATWNTPRSDAGTFRCEVDLKVVDIDLDGRQEIIFISFDGLVIASLSSTDFSNPSFEVEYSNFSEFQWTFASEIADLDNNGTNELITCGGWGAGSFNILESVAPGFYVMSVNWSLNQLPGGAGMYNTITSADLDGNGFPEVYYADTDGNFRSIVLNGPHNALDATHFNLLASVGSEVLTVIQRDNSFYLGTSAASEIFRFDYSGGTVTDSLSFQMTEIFADSDTGDAAITVFRIAGATDLDGDEKEDIVFAAANHDSSKPTLYVIEAQTATSVTYRQVGLFPDGFKLEQNYPNPFNPTTNITFTLPLDKNISLKIYNSLGQEVKTLVDDQTYAEGSYTIQWNAKDNSGNPVASGVYVYKLVFGNFSKSKSMTLVR